MNAGRTAKQILFYEPRGERSVRCPMKRWEGNLRL
jgi:hypothetical protein